MDANNYPERNQIFADEQLARISKVPKRELMRRGIKQHTLGNNLGKSAGQDSQICEVFTGIQGATVLWLAASSGPLSALYL